MPAYECLPCEDVVAWDTLVSESPHGTVFCSTDFLSGLEDVQYDTWQVLYNGCTEAGAVVLRSGDTLIGSGYHLCPYLGVLIAKHVCAQPIHRRSRRTVEILKCLIETLTSHYTGLRFSFHPNFEDLRPFQWHNYSEPETNQFRVSLRYSGLIQLKGLADFDDYLMTLPKTRRYEYRQALKRGYRVIEFDDIESLVELHQQSFANQGLECSNSEIIAVRNVARVTLEEGLGQMLACIDSEDHIASAALFISDEHWGYHVTGGNDPDYRNDFSGTYLFLDYIRRAMITGLEVVDVVGMNSPDRGSFKSSFNAVLTPYHIAEWSIHK